ncbi:MAG: DNA repair protein RecN [Thermacetogeniaceae bacterium]
MLVQLTVDNLALIEHISLDLGSGLNVLTGETGAGKSILVDAMDILTGGRASGDLVRTGAERALVEGLFDCIQLPQVSGKLAEFGMTASEDCSLLLSREIMANGRSTCRINGRAVPLAMYRTLGEMLVDLHGQHEHQSLLKVDKHRELFDRFGGDEISRQLFVVADLYDRLSELATERSAADAGEKEIAGRIDYLACATEEIGRLGPVPGEDEVLRQEAERLRHAERLAELAREAALDLFEGDDRRPAAYDLLSRALSSLQEMSRYDASVGDISAPLAEVQFRLEDVVDALRRYRELLEFNPTRAREVEERLHALRGLTRKYGPSLADVIVFLDGAHAELDNLKERQSRLRDLEAEYQRGLRSYEAAAGALSDLRHQKAAAFIEAVQGELQGLGMKKARFDTKWESTPGSRRWGSDQLEFLFSANPGEPLKPLARIASGGEMSRVMLALKVIFAENDEIPTLIFDEIDTGIGGRTLQAVADRLAVLSRHKQVLCVTHSPHIAGRGARHFNIEKVITGDLTRTVVKLLDSRSRVSEIARMLGGAEDEEITRIHAEQILKEVMSNE